jgi:hypothetical protein
MQETRNEEVNETGNEVETRLVLLCKTGNEGNSGGGQKHGNEEAFFTPPRFHISIRFQRLISTDGMNIATFNDGITAEDLKQADEPSHPAKRSAPCRRCGGKAHSRRTFENARGRGDQRRRRS